MKWHEVSQFVSFQVLVHIISNPIIETMEFHIDLCISGYHISTQRSLDYSFCWRIAYTEREFGSIVDRYAIAMCFQSSPMHQPTNQDLDPLD